MYYNIYFYYSNKNNVKNQYIFRLLFFKAIADFVRLELCCFVLAHKPTN